MGVKRKKDQVDDESGVGHHAASETEAIDSEGQLQQSDTDARLNNEEPLLVQNSSHHSVERLEVDTTLRIKNDTHSPGTRENDAIDVDTATRPPSNEAIDHRAVEEVNYNSSNSAPHGLREDDTNNFHLDGSTLNDADRHESGPILFANNNNNTNTTAAATGNGTTRSRNEDDRVLGWTRRELQSAFSSNPTLRKEARAVIKAASLNDAGKRKHTISILLRLRSLEAESRTTTDGNNDPLSNSAKNSDPPASSADGATDLPNNSNSSSGRTSHSENVDDQPSNSLDGSGHPSSSSSSSSSSADSSSSAT